VREHDARSAANTEWGGIGAGTEAAIGLIAGPPGFLAGALVGGVAGSFGGLYWGDIETAAK